MDPFFLILAESSALLRFHLDKHPVIAVHRYGIEEVRDSTSDSHLSVPDQPALSANGLIRDVKQELETRVSPAPLDELLLLL